MQAVLYQERIYTKSENGLAQTWTGVCWCNPPFGRQIGLWLAKAREAALSGATVVALIPARTDTKWWHGIVIAASEIRYLPGRLRFGGCKHSAPFPSARNLEAVPMTIYALVRLYRGFTKP
jgi:DNA N-6-adenine-methyltransferase Dam